VPATIGPFTNGVWNGLVRINKVQSDVEITASSGPATGTSNKFNVTFTPSVGVGFITTEAFTHVLSIEIHGDSGEHFNVTTAPLNLDEPAVRGAEPEQIGVITVVPNDFTLGFYQNRSGTHIYSQHDSVIANIPDKNSLGLHDFQYRFFDRFNNTFIVPYIIWIRQPTAIIMEITTVRDGANINRTQVWVTAQLLYQRYDKPDETPNIPLENKPMKIYVQNASTDAYGDGFPLDPAGCNPGVPGVCPNPASGITHIEDSNCSCPDWWDDELSPGDCYPNPGCHQYGRLSDITTGNLVFTTNASGHVNTTFKIYGFGRRLLFAVFWGDNEYAPSIQIKPFYAGGLSVEMGSFTILEPVLLLLASLALLKIKRKFMLRT